MDNKDVTEDSEDVFEVVNLKKCKRNIKTKNNKKVEQQEREEVEDLLKDLGINIKW
jgi:hypothetical protein